MKKKYVRYGVLLIAVLLLCFFPWRNVVGSGRTTGAGKGTGRAVQSFSEGTSASRENGKNTAGTGLPVISDSKGISGGSMDGAGDFGGTAAGDNTGSEGTSGQGNDEGSSSASGQDSSSSQMVDDYPYDPAADRQTYDLTQTEITVGDRLYMTQINDWFRNFADYKDKTVEIEGYYLTFDPYTFIGRKGPSCPYCTGGYVDFEIKTDQDLSSLVPEQDWIRVKGILREGSSTYASGKKQAFYYIEALEVEKLPEAGVGTVSE